MATRPLPPPEPDRNKKTHTTGAVLEMIRSVSKRSTFQNLHVVMKKRWLRVAGIVVAILVVLLIALPFVINVNSFRPKIESEASNALGRQVRLGDLSLSILSGSVGVEDISIADDPAFSKNPFVTAKSLKVGVELMPLIFSKKLNVTDITLKDPTITLLKAVNGTWNFSSLGGAANKPAETKAGGSSAPPDISIGKLAIDDGRLLIGNANSSAKPVAYDKVNVTVTNFSPRSQFPFKLTANLPGGGDADINGKAGPINATDASKTPFESTVKVKNMVIEAMGMIDPASGLAGLANFDGTLNSNGSQAKAVGTFTGNKLKFSPKGTPAPKTVTIKHAVDLDLDKQTGTLSQGDIAIGNAQAHLTGTFQTQGQTQNLNMKLNAPNMPVDDLEAMLPSLGVVLPSGSQLKGGTLSTDLTIVGPVDKLVITGPVKLSNTKLAGFNLGQKLGALSAITGKTASNPDTSIQNASLNARVAPEGTKADNINLTVPAIGVITGAGTVSPAGALNFNMLANLEGGMAGDVTKMASLGGGKGIPFTIQGTTSNPSFVPDMAGVAGSVAKGALGNAIAGEKGVTKGTTDATSALGGLLGKKKKPK